MTLTKGSPRRDTEMYNDQEVPTLLLESDDGPIEGFQIKSEVGFYDFINISDSHPIDPPLVLAQKRTFEDFLESRLKLQPTDIKMPLLKRARFYKEQSVNTMLSKFEVVNSRLKEVEKKFEEQTIVNQELQKKVKDLKNKKNNWKTKQLFLQDFVAIHNNYFRAQQHGVDSQEEQRVLNMVIRTMSEYQVESLVSSTQSLTKFLDTLRGRLEMLISERVTNANKVDEEARWILIGVGCKNLRETENKYTRKDLGEELVTYFFKSSGQNLSQ